MSERRIIGWVVTLLPAEKGGAREWQDANTGDTTTADKGSRHVWPAAHFSQASKAMDAIADQLGLNELIARLRVLPVYSRPVRTAKDERRDVVEFILRRIINEHPDAASRRVLSECRDAIQAGKHEASS